MTNNGNPFLVLFLLVLFDSANHIVHDTDVGLLEAMHHPCALRIMRAVAWMRQDRQTLDIMEIRRNRGQVCTFNGHGNSKALRVVQIEALAMITITSSEKKSRISDLQTRLSSGTVTVGLLNETCGLRDFLSVPVVGDWLILRTTGMKVQWTGRYKSRAACSKQSNTVEEHVDL